MKQNAKIVITSEIRTHLDDILNYLCFKFKVSKSSIRGKKRTGELVRIRQLFCYLINQIYPNLKLRDIAYAVCDTYSHSDVIYAIKEYAKSLNFDTNKSIAVVNRQIYSSIIREICQKMPVSQIKNSYIRSYYELVIEGQTVTVEQSVYQHIVKLEQMVEEYVKLVQNIKQNKI